jgi:ABC-type glutathione transport system ATPase component
MDLPMLRLENVTLTAGNATLVEGVSFEVLPGQTTCLVGASGSGKSLIAKAIMGLLPSGVQQTDGAIYFNGKDLNTLSSEERRSLRGQSMAMIFQEPMSALNPVLTIGYQIEEVFLAHTNIPRAKRLQAVESLLKKVGIAPEKKKSYADELSGGQRQRVMIAMAVALSPQLLLADEPTTALDVTVQAQILQLLQDIQQHEKMSMLFITHDFGIVSMLADEIIVLRKGRIVEQGLAERILAAPRHPYTQELMSLAA